MQSGAALELVFASGLVVVPVHPMPSVVYSPSLMSRSLVVHLHLLASEDETLLCWRNAFLFFNALLDARDLWVALCQPNCPSVREVCVCDHESKVVVLILRAMSYFVVGLNVELNLLAGQGAHSTKTWLATGSGV